MSEWPIIRLGDYINSSLGKMLNAQKNKGQLQPYLGNSNVRWGAFDLADLAQMKFEEHEGERYRIRDGDLIVCEGGEPGRCAIWREEISNMKIQKALHRIRTKKELNNYYLFYWFRLAGRTGKLEPHFTGTTIKHLTGKAVSALELPLPPIATQEAIARILKSLDDKIELNRRMNETLEAIARAMFKSWFVDFDPVRARMGGEPPESICQRFGFTPDLLALFPDRLVNSELGDGSTSLTTGIPEGWSVGTLSDVAQHPRRGIQPSRIATATPYIALEHMPRRCIALSDWDVADDLESNKFEFKKGEILFGKLRPYFHKVGVAPVDGVCSTDIVVITPKADEWFGFVLGHVSSEAFVEHTNAGSTGTKMPRTSWSDMSRYPIVMPPKETAEAFTNFVRPAIERITASIHEARTLASLRDALLPQLLSGELRVPDDARYTEMMML